MGSNSNHDGTFQNGPLEKQPKSVLAQLATVLNHKPLFGALFGLILFAREFHVEALKQESIGRLLCQDRWIRLDEVEGGIEVEVTQVGERKGDRRGVGELFILGIGVG